MDPSGRWVVGFCGGFFLHAIASVAGSGCLVRTEYEPGGRDDIGYTATTGKGWGSNLSVGLSLGILISNADYIQDLGGPFFAANISAIRVGASYFVGKGPYTGRRVMGIEVSYNIGASLANYGAGWLLTKTKTHVVRQWWLADPLRGVWNALASTLGLPIFFAFWSAYINYLNAH